MTRRERTPGPTNEGPQDRPRDARRWRRMGRVKDETMQDETDVTRMSTAEPEAEPSTIAPENAPEAQADLAAQLEAEKGRSAELLDSWQRARAEFLNFKRRTEQERQREAQMAGLMVIARVLPILDDFDLALANRPQGNEVAGWVDGVALVAHKLRTVLESEGVQPIAAAGQKFDPALHEAIMVEDGGGEYVVSELRRGYTLNGQVIRPALVKVGKGSNE
jgi:molecular chaperone GrpE